MFECIKNMFKNKIRPSHQAWYGWKPDIPDHRDKLYKDIQQWQVDVPLPEKVDLRDKCSIIENQGQLGSCTANAIAGNLEFLDKQDGTYIDVSRLFIYYNERVMIGTIHEDSGAYIRDGIKSVVNQGYCSEKRWPYNINRYDKKPNIMCYREAEQHKVTSYHRILSLHEMQCCLAEGYPVIFGFAVYTNFNGKEVATTGILNMPSATDKMVGGHAVLAVGYDQTTQRILVRNSWGNDWGIQGYFTMPYQYIETMADDMWTIRK